MSLTRFRAPRTLSRLSRFSVVFLLVSALGFVPAVATAQTQIARQFNVVPITITGVTVVNGGLAASLIYGGNTFTGIPIALTATPNQTPGECPILNLSLAPIDLNVLGLEIHTSAICLDITAHDNQGLLGDLLCSIANLLSNNTPLADILAGLSADETSRLNAGLTSVLNQAVFTPLTSSPALVGASCNILNLALGPIDLNLLGLQVELDDCAGGPVTLDVVANPMGGLLGNLLCGLANLLDQPARANLVLRLIARVIGVLVA